MRNNDQVALLLPDGGAYSVKSLAKEKTVIHHFIKQGS